MNISNITASLSSLEGLITAISGLIAATATILKVVLERRRGRIQGRSKSLDWTIIISGVVFVISAALLIINIVSPPKPELAITTPKHNEQIVVEIPENSGGTFSVQGTSLNVNKNQNARIAVLIHPSDPFDAGWWLQPTVYDHESGNWSAKSWVGNPEFPPMIGYQYDIMAVVADAAIIAQNIKVADPMDLKTQAQTGIFHVTIGKVNSSQTSPPVAPTEEPPAPIPTEEEFIFSPTLYNGQLAKGMQLDVASSGNLSDWVIEENRTLHIAYPEGQDWGAVFITSTTQDIQDVSAYQTLSLELRGETGGESALVGLKDAEDPNDGSETKIPIFVTQEWQTYEIPLEAFETADLSMLKVFVELIFEGLPQSIEVRNISYTTETANISIFPYPIFFNGKLEQGYTLGVASSGNKSDWVSQGSEFDMLMAYPSGQAWGAAFIFTTDADGQDLSNYQTLSLELRGENGGESVKIGLKDIHDPDDGSETKITVENLPANWKTYIFPLDNFTTSDLTKLEVLIEFVFEGNARDVYFRNLVFLP